MDDDMKREILSVTGHFPLTFWPSFTSALVADTRARRGHVVLVEPSKHMVHLVAHVVRPASARNCNAMVRQRQRSRLQEEQS